MGYPEPEEAIYFARPPFPQQHEGQLASLPYNTVSVELQHRG